MKKLFVSQPMNGKSSDEILKERKYLIAKAEAHAGETLEVLDTFFEDARRMQSRCGIWENR